MLPLEMTYPTPSMDDSTITMVTRKIEKKAGGAVDSLVAA
jgi:hypothetical protein